MPGRVQSFEDLIAWQKARVLARDVYLLTRSGGLERDFGLAGQLQRAAVSVMANIAEVYERRGKAEYLRFLAIAKASCAEVCSHLYVAFDVGYVSETNHHALLEQAREVGRIIAGLSASLSASDLGPRASDRR